MVGRVKKQKMVLTWLLAVLVLVGGGYLWQKHFVKPKKVVAGPPPGYVPESERGPVIAKLQADVKPVGKANESGKVNFKEVNGRVYLELDLTGDLAKGPLPADIYRGTCKAPGNPLYSLSPVVDGKTENYLKGTMAEFEAKFPLAVHVHNNDERKPGNLAMALLTADVACADLVKP